VRLNRRSERNTSPTAQSHEIFLGEEEIADVSLATFYVFDKENAGMPAPAQKVAFGSLMPRLPLQERARRQAEREKLYRIANGWPESFEQSAAGVNAETDARAAAALEQHAGVYANKGYTEEQQIEIVGRRPITSEELRQHKVQYEANQSNPDFMTKWMAGSKWHIEEMNRLAVAMRLPIGTLQDIERWQNG
jgi:hypothetical protein